MQKMFFNIQLYFHIETIVTFDIKWKGLRKKGALTTSFDGDHFGIYTVGEVTLYLIKNTCFAAPTGTVIDVYNLDFLILQIYLCHQGET
jgi:hypothetical protein